MYYDTKYSPTKNLKPLNFAKGRTFAPKIILDEVANADATDLGFATADMNQIYCTISLC